MEYPMKIYGLNLFERFLADFLAVLGWLLVLFTIISGIFFLNAFFTNQLVAGILVAATPMTGIWLLLASSGIRQNRAALDVGSFFLLLTGFGWLVSGLFTLKIAAIAAGIIMLAFFGLLVFLRRQALRARFKLRFFTVRQFEAMVQIADTMIDGEGQEALHPIEVALQIDHLLDKVDSPMKKDIRKYFLLLEWLLSLMIFRPFPFSDMGSNARRRAVEKVIGAKGLFRDLARALKTLACFGYYGNPQGMAKVGYRPFEERKRFRGVDQTPKKHPDPFLTEGGK